MRINSLMITNFKGLEDISIKFKQPSYRYFDNSNLNILVGENGTGKSSILQLLTYIFCPNERKSDTVTNFNFEVNYTVNDNTHIFTNRDIYPDVFPKKLIVSSFAVFDPFSIRRHLYMGNKLVVKKEVSPNETEYVYCGPLESRHSSLSPLIQAVLECNYIQDEEKKVRYKELIKKVGYREAEFIEISRNFNEIKRNIEKLNNENSPAVQAVREYYLRLINLLKNKRVRKLEDTFHRRDYLISTEDFGDELYPLLSNLKEFEFNTMIKDIWFKNDGVAPVSLSNMSSGQVTMLFRFLPLIKEIEPNTLILIDEPETHLHPRWTQEFVEYLTDLFGHYAVHFIVATHSPLIAADVPAESITGLLNEQGRIKPYYPKDRTLGGHSNEILRDVFQINDLSSKFAHKYFAKMEELLQSKVPLKVEQGKIMFDDLSSTLEKFEIYKKYKGLFGE